MESQRTSRSEVTPFVGDGELQGVVAQYVDDVAFAGHPSAAPLAPLTHGQNVPDYEENAELGGTTLQCRAVPGTANAELDATLGHAAAEPGDVSEFDGDLEDDAAAIPQQTRVQPTRHTDRDQPLDLVVFPGWTLRTPPRALWPTLTGPPPEWGGDEGRFHQEIPLGYTKDFTYVCHRRWVMIRFHCRARRAMYVPHASTLPPGITVHDLTGRRRTLVAYDSPRLKIPAIEDHFDRVGSRRMLDRLWKGRTEFQLVLRQT